MWGYWGIKTDRCGKCHCLLYSLLFLFYFSLRKPNARAIIFIIIINASPPDYISEGMHILYADGVNILS